MFKEKQDIHLTLVLIVSTARYLIQMCQNDHQNCLFVSFYKSQRRQCNVAKFLALTANKIQRFGFVILFVLFRHWILSLKHFFC